MRKKVVILGGGIAGMSAAQELVERGFEVEVFERNALPGGKARSIDGLGSATGLPGFGSRAPARAPDGVVRPPLPGEHGFRFFPGFYRHVIDTMARIPFDKGSVAQNLVDTTELRIAPFDSASCVIPARFPRTSDDLKTDVFAVIAAMSGQLGVPLDEGLFFATKAWQFLTSCEERRLVEYERINWWDFIDAGSRSASYQKYFGNGITRSLVAAKARRASTKTIGDIFMQIVFGILLPGVAADRLLNGPTNDVWITPWLRYLREQGVAYHLNAAVRAIRCQRSKVCSATVAVGNSVREVTGDFFIAALPVERMVELLSPDMLACDPSLANLNALTEYVEWMNGIQYYLTEDVPIAKGHTIYVDSPWALTSVSQAQFWRNFDFSQHGDGTVRGVLSVDISDWDVKGLNGKEARYCSRQEIALETWAQLKRSLNVGAEILKDRHLHSWFLDPDIVDMDADNDPRTPRLDTNMEPLLVNYVDTWPIRPEAVTRIPNFFLASDYVRTHTDLATMEAANEAARRAVNGILRAARCDIDPCAIWNLHEPEVFLPVRAYDRVRYRKGLPWNCEPVALARSTLERAREANPALSPLRPDPAFEERAFRMVQALGSAGDIEQAAAQGRASSDQGLRRLRVVRQAP